MRTAAAPPKSVAAFVKDSLRLRCIIIDGEGCNGGKGHDGREGAA